MADIIPNPQQIDIDNKGVAKKWLSVYDASVTLAADASSSATIRLKEGSTIRSLTYVKMFTNQGEAGIFRSRSPVREIGGHTSQIQMEHAVNALGDILVKQTIEKETTVKEALKLIFDAYTDGGGKLWKLGTVEHDSDKVVLDVDYDNCLEAIDSIMEQVPELMFKYNWTTFPWKLNVVSRETDITAEARLARNIRSVQITRDDSELYTRVYIKSAKGKDKYISVDSPTYIGKYGVREKVIDGANSTDDIAKSTARAYLHRHWKPRYTVNIDGIELSNITGEKLDKFSVGKKLRLILNDYLDEPVEENITQISWFSVYKEPNAVRVTLADEEDTVVRQIAKKSRSSGRTARKTRKKADNAYAIAEEGIHNIKINKEAHSITFYDANGNQVGGTFSNAVTLVGAWQGDGSYKSTATVGGSDSTTLTTLLTNITRTTQVITLKPKSDKILMVPLKVMYRGPSGDASTGFTKIVEIDGSLAYTKGYEKAYKEGWLGAYAKVVIPSEAATSSHISVYVPAGAVGVQGVHYYYPDVDNNYCYIRYNSSSGTVVSRKSHTIRNNVTIQEPTWASSATGSTNNATFSTNAPTPQTRKLYVKLTQTSNTVYMAASNSGSTWVNYAKLDIDNDWTLPGAPSTSSSEPSGSFDKSWPISKAYNWIYFTVSCNGESKKFKIHLTS